MLDKQPDAKVVVPPHKTVIYSETRDAQRNEHILAIQEHGRISGQKKTDYVLRAHVELAMQRYKGIIGN